MQAAVNMTADQRTMPILNSSDDWIYWYDEVKRMSKRLRVWEYVNPEIPREHTHPLPEPSTPPPYIQVQPGAKSYADLSERKQKVYEYEFDECTRRNQQIDTIRNGYYTIEDLVHSTVPAQHQYLLLEPETVYAKLRILYEYFSTYSHEATVKMERKWERLRKSPKMDMVQDWLTDWDRYLVEARCSVPGHLQERGRTDNPSTIMSFLEAAYPLVPDFIDPWKALTKEGEEASTHDIIQKFRVRIQLEWLEAEQRRG